MTDLSNTKNHIRTILGMLDDVENDLKSAKNWGIVDLFGGEGISSFVKHRKISSAEKRLDNVIYELNFLQRELKSLNIPSSSQINAGNFNKFMDIFMDNIFSDIYTQSKINDGLKNVKEIRSMLENIYYDLNKM